MVAVSGLLWFGEGVTATVRAPAAEGLIPAFGVPAAAFTFSHLTPDLCHVPPHASRFHGQHLAHVVNSHAVTNPRKLSPRQDSQGATKICISGSVKGRRWQWRWTFCSLRRKLTTCVHNVPTFLYFIPLQGVGWCALTEMEHRGERHGVKVWSGKKKYVPSGAQARKAVINTPRKDWMNEWVWPEGEGAVGGIAMHCGIGEERIR